MDQVLKNLVLVRDVVVHVGLFQKVREERGLAYSIYSYLNVHSDAGALVVYGGTSADELWETVLLALEQFASLKDGQICADELQMSKEQMKGTLLLSLESSDNRMTRLAKNEIFLGCQPQVEEIVAAIDRVNVDDVQRLANRIMVDDSLNLNVVGPVSDADLRLDNLTISG